MIGRAILAALRVITLPIERKVLKKKMAGIGIAGDGVLNDFLLKDRLIALRAVLELRGVDVVDVTPLQTKWVMHNPEKRDAYYSWGIDKFPDAHFYVLLRIVGTTIQFGVYGAAFKELQTGSIDVVTASVFKSLDHYFQDTLCSRIAHIMRKYPHVFHGSMWFRETTDTGTIRKIFTLPPSFH